MEIIQNEKYCIITPLSPKLGEREIIRLYDEIISTNSPKIGLDLSFVKDCTIDFVELIKSIKNVSLFNIPSDVFALFTGMNLDKTVKMYVSELDFFEDKHRLLNRKLTLV